MHLFISDKTLEGDKFARGLLNNFLTEFIEKFSKKNKGYLWDVVLERVQKEDISQLLKREQMYELVGSLGDVPVEKGEKILFEVADFTKNWLNENVDHRVTFEGHYKKDWSNTPLKEDGYHIGQYNAMLVNSTLRNVIARIVRNHMFRFYSKLVSQEMARRGTRSYVISWAGIDKYGLYDPNPTFSNHKDEKPVMLSTEQPDINILKPFFEQFNLVEFLPEKNGVSQCRYLERGDFPRTLQALNELKYKHFNMGDAPRRRVLNLGTEQMEYSEDLDPNKVVGNWRHYY